LCYATLTNIGDLLVMAVVVLAAGYSGCKW
jgi:hypothetical protein